MARQSVLFFSYRRHIMPNNVKDLTASKEQQLLNDDLVDRTCSRQAALPHDHVGIDAPTISETTVEFEADEKA